MRQWEYQTLIVRQAGEKVINVTHVNSKDAVQEVTGRLVKTRTYHDLPSYLGKAGREGWEVVGMSTTTNNAGGGMSSEGSIDVLIILKRPVEGE